MKHLGDITKIDGHNVPLVDIVCGGSPCQDLSVAGKRAGLAGERSGLFMEQIRIIKEMRDESAKRLRSGGATFDIRHIQPRYMVWENVPGAFSSNKGEDFRCVLEETAKIVDERAVIPRPKNGKWSPSGCIMGDGWSIAWRVHDAQFWGVPQRRKRIALVADFGGQSAPEILFERQSVSGNLDESREEGQEAAGNVRTSIGTSNSRLILFEPRSQDGVPRIHGDISPTLNTAQGGQRQPCVVLEGNGSRPSHRGDGYAESDISFTLNAVEKHAVCYRADSITSPINASNPKEEDLCHTLTDDIRNYVIEKSNYDFIARRLTPMECERLQGYPDHWTDIGEWTDSKGKLHKDADSPRYKALGNSIALPFWEWMAKRMVSHLDTEQPTMASLFDGIGGFPLVYSRAGCTPIWASEIEEFPIAVTKIHFPDITA